LPVSYARRNIRELINIKNEDGIKARIVVKVVDLL
jgi:hypothetical protein